MRHSRSGRPGGTVTVTVGAALILAVAFSTWAARMQARQFRAQQLRQLDTEDAADSDAFRGIRQAAHKKERPSI